MVINYNRSVAHNNLDYKRALRNQRIQYSGLEVQMIVPTVLNYDANGDLVYAKDGVTETKTVSVIPLYNQYRQIIDIVGLSIENPIPLEIIVPTDVEFLRGTKLIIPIDDQPKEWKVLSSKLKHIDYTQVKSVTVVPWRHIPEIEEVRTEDQVSEKAETDKMIQEFNL